MYLCGHGIHEDVINNVFQKVSQDSGEWLKCSLAYDRRAFRRVQRSLIYHKKARYVLRPRHPHLDGKGS